MTAQQYVLPMEVVRDLRAPVNAPDDLVRLCKNRLDAIRLCIQLSRMAHQDLCKYLRINKGHFCRMMQGRAYFPDDRSIDLMVLCGNMAPAQYEAMALGRKLVETNRDDLIADLQRRLADRGDA